MDTKEALLEALLDGRLPDKDGRFGPFGGRYVPETLMHPLRELEAEYYRAQQDPDFQRELGYYLAEFCGRPTPLYLAERLTRELGGAKIYPPPSSCTATASAPMTFPTSRCAPRCATRPGSRPCSRGR